MIGAISPTTESRSWPVPSSSSSSSATLRGSWQTPVNGEQADRLLKLAERALASREGRTEAARALAGFLGANSSVWSVARRARIAELLVSAGIDGLRAVLGAIEQAPVVAVEDDARLILRKLAKTGPAACAELRNYARVASAPVRVASVRALADGGDERAAEFAAALLKADSDEARDAAVWALARLGAVARGILTAHAARESSALVKESIASVLADLDPG